MAAAPAPAAVPWTEPRHRLPRHRLPAPPPQPLPTTPIALATIAAALPNRLAQWPCQIKLVPVQAPYYQGRGLLIAADCTAFACASFHERFMSGNVTIIGCPKLDEGSYTDKLAAIIAANDITSVTVARMEVPCCGGLERAAAEACAQSGKDIPFEVVTFAVNGDVIS